MRIARYERDYLDGAEREPERGVELAERTGEVSTLVWAYVTLSRTRRGDGEGALEMAREAERGARDSGADLQIALNAMGVVAAWAVLNTAYALYYAHTYHGNEENSAGLEFPGGKEPGMLDFAYFSFAVGTSFAASDVKVIGMISHRVVPGHTILSFAYSTVLIAVVVNVITDL